jgi:hypothetical protein
LPTAHPIKSHIDAGSVYYYNDPRLQAPYPHYCIVVNISPLEDKTIILVHASHRINKVKERRKNCPEETLVEISTIQYTGFDKDSIIDCNEYLETDIEMLANKLDQGRLEMKPLIGLRLVRQLRKGLIASNQVPQRIKDLLTE